MRNVMHWMPLKRRPKNMTRYDSLTTYAIYS
jgi:hypothetical protein